LIQANAANKSKLNRVQSTSYVVTAMIQGRSGNSKPLNDHKIGRGKMSWKSVLLYLFGILVLELAADGLFL
jgi:hypothetical protein